MCYRLKYLVLLMLVIGTNGVIAQEEEEGCALTLIEAQKLYDDGLIEQIEKTLQPCIDKGFTADETEQAFRLIILASLYSDSPSETSKG